MIISSSFYLSFILNSLNSLIPFQKLMSILFHAVKACFPAIFCILLTFPAVCPESPNLFCKRLYITGFKQFARLTIPYQFRNSSQLFTPPSMTALQYSIPMICSFSGVTYFRD